MVRASLRYALVSIPLVSQSARCEREFVIGRRILENVLHPAHLRRTSLIALVVGTWLTAFNHGDSILAEAFDLGLAVKILLNYATPFVVANLGLLSRETEGEDGEQKNQ